MLKKFSLFFVFLSIAYIGSGQTGFGISAGLNMATITEDDAEEAQMKPGFYAGVETDIALAGAFYIRPAIVFSSKGTKNHISGDSHLNLNYLELPVNFVYEIFGFRFSAGPYFSLAISGKEEINGNAYRVVFKDQVYLEDMAIEEFYYKRFDYGLNTGVGYKITESFRVRLNYGLGLANFQPEVLSHDPRIDILNKDNKHSVLHLSLVYSWQ